MPACFYGHQGEFLDWQGCLALEGAALRGGGVPIPGGVQERLSVALSVQNLTLQDS